MLSTDAIDAEPLRVAAAAEEQEWNGAHLALPVVRRRLAAWAYREPAVVLGAAQRPSAALVEAAHLAGIAVAQRRSGGGAVLAGPWLLGVSAVLPPDDALIADGVVAAYRWLGEAHAQAFAVLGMGTRPATPAEAHAAGRAGAELRWACFGALSPWEVVDRFGRKLVGMAQVRRRTGVLLVAGTLLDAPDWATLCRVFGRPQSDARLLAQRTTSCSAILGRPADIVEVAQAVTAAVGERVGARPVSGITPRPSARLSAPA